MTAETFLNGKIQLCCGDSLHFLRDQPDNQYDSIVTDPPYALVSIVKRFGGDNAAPVKVSEFFDADENSKGSSPYLRASAGFMGKKWDTGETAFAVEFWQQCLRVLKPGGYVLAFGGTRTYHRLACAIEDAGFEVRDMIQWMYGQGFPKSHDVSKGIDRAAGAERGNAGVGKRDIANYGMKNRCPACDKPYFSGDPCQCPKPEAVTDAAREWEGWGTALKPACEPICMARKPLSEKTVAANVLKWGTGAINVDGCRVGTESTVRHNHGGTGNPEYWRTGNGDDYTAGSDAGRWPANVIHDGSEEVVAAFPADLTSGKPAGIKAGNNNNVFGQFAGGIPVTGFGDTGSAAGFFYQAAKDDRCDLCDANIAPSPLPIENTPSASIVRCDAAVSPSPENSATDHQSSDRAIIAARHSKECRQPNGPTAESNAPTPLQQKIVRNVSSVARLCDSCATGIAQEIVAASRKEPLGLSLSEACIGVSKKTILLRCLASYVEGRESTDTILTTTNLRELFGCAFHAIAESINSAKAGSAESTAPAPKRLWYSSKADADDRLGSKHPTVKPVDLMQYLVRLVTPKGGLVLDPFAGTGTTAEAAFREGMRCALVEREAEYQADVRRRMALCMAGPDERSRESIKAKMIGLPPDHGPLFALKE